MAVLVSLREFVAFGAFGPMVPGCTPTDLEAVFGPPEATGGTSRRHRRPAIWKSGDARFYFGRSGRLYLVHLDTFTGLVGAPKGWDGLKLDSWCVREGLTIDEFLVVAGTGQ
ncbi:MAG: hypothetical protein ACRDD1_21755, partial [Planctomycetia bacterium]